MTITTEDVRAIGLLLDELMTTMNRHSMPTGLSVLF